MTVAELSSRYEGVQVCADNQEVVDRSVTNPDGTHVGEISSPRMDVEEQ
ncbi:hypothetical protein ACWC9R_14065 [Streptomyces sp. NPDC001219]